MPIYVTRGEGQRLDNARPLHGEFGGGRAGRAGCGAKRGGASVCCLTFPSDPVRLCRGPSGLQPLPGSQREPGLPLVQPRPACLSLWATVPIWGRGAAVSNTHHRHGQPPSPSPDPHPPTPPQRPSPSPPPPPQPHLPCLVPHCPSLTQLRGAASGWPAGQAHPTAQQVWLWGSQGHLPCCRSSP